MEPGELWKFDGKASGPGVLDVVWEAVTYWYSLGLEAHPMNFICPPRSWRKVMMEAGASGNKQGTIGIQEVLTPTGKRNAIVVVGPIAGGWLFFADPAVKDLIKVYDKEWIQIGEIEAW